MPSKMTSKTTKHWEKFQVRTAELFELFVLEIGSLLGRERGLDSAKVLALSMAL